MCSVNVSERGKGEGQVIFRYLLQQQQQQGASVPIEVSAPSGSALPPAPLCGWAGPTTPTVSQTGWAGQRAMADEERLFNPCNHQNTVYLCRCVVSQDIFVEPQEYVFTIVQWAFHRNNIHTLKNYRAIHCW